MAAPVYPNAIPFEETSSMTRTSGSKNITPFEQRDEICSTSSQEIKHLAVSEDATALEQLKDTIKHQKNFLKWIKSRHDEIIKLKRKIASHKKKRATSPKEATYRKYRWYAEQALLLESINAFEVFYKQSLIGLAKSIRAYVPLDRIKGSVDAKVLWGLRRASIPELLFEHQLYHDLDSVDKACDVLVQARRYNKNNPSSQLRETVKSIQAIFQIRHSLSHNHGVITLSDQSKFKVLGYRARVKEVIDPSKDALGESVNRLLLKEAEEFTEWLLTSTASYLVSQQSNAGKDLDSRVKVHLENYIGNNADVEALSWV